MSAERVNRLELRALTEPDVPAMLALERVCYSTPWSRWMLADEVTRERGLALGAWEGERLVAMLLAARLADAWHILNVAVDPVERRGGIASLLLETLFERIAQGDSIGCTLEVRPSNDAAIELYVRHGFELAGRRPGYYVDGEDAIVMWRAPQSVLEARARGEQVEWEQPT